MTVEHDALVGLWRMGRKLNPTFEGDGWTARIIWQPVGVCSWELASGDGHRFSTLDRFRDAREAKEDLWRALTEQGAGASIEARDVPRFIERMNALRGHCRTGGRPALALTPSGRPAGLMLSDARPSPSQYTAIGRWPGDHPPAGRGQAVDDPPVREGAAATGREARLGQPPNVKPTAVGPEPSTQAKG